MNLKELLEDYVKADLEISKLEKIKSELIIKINENYLNNLSSDKINIIEVNEQVYLLSIVHDRDSKKQKENPLKLHKFSIHTAEIHK